MDAWRRLAERGLSSNDQESLARTSFRTSLCCSSSSSPGKSGYQLPAAGRSRRWMPPRLWAQENVRAEIEDFPEVSEVEVIRHFTRLSTWNYAIDLGLYPLGSCTMKYNPRINELVARIEGLAWAHPYQPEALSQGCMEVIAALEASAG